MHLSYWPRTACQTLFWPRLEGIPIETTWGELWDAEDDGHDEQPPPHPPPDEPADSGWNTSHARRAT